MENDSKQHHEDDLLETLQYDLKEPDMWQVILLNDDYTPRDFVVEILVSIFHKNPIEATNIMLEVHNTGRGLVGIYPYDIGRTKIAQVTELAQKQELPLKGVLEKA